MELTIERYHPIVLAILGGIISWYSLQYLALSMPRDEKEFLAAALSLGAVLTGFIATAQAILMALPSDSVMGRLRATGYIEDLTKYIGSAFLGALLFCLISLTGFAVLYRDIVVKNVFWAVWVGFGVYSVFSFLRVSRIMLRIMQSQ